MNKSTSSLEYRTKSPISGGADGNKHANMFQTPQWRDVWAAVLFYVHFFAFIGLSVYVYMESDFLSTPGAGTNPKNDALLELALYALGGSIGISLVLTVVSMIAMYSAPLFMMHVSFIANLFLSAAITLLNFLNGFILAGCLFGVVTLLNGLFYFMVRKRFPFSALLLETVIGILKTYPAMLSVSAGSVVVTMIYFTYVGSVLASLAILANKQNPAVTYLLVYTAFSLFWTIQVIQNVVQTTIAGVYATYYFLAGTGQVVVNPTLQSFKRSISYSFGSICFGSLVVAVIQTVRFLLNMINDKDSIVGAIVDCLIGVIEDLVRYFNYYAYTQIAIYGKPYIDAAKDTFQLIKSRGIDAIVNDSLIGTCIMMVSLFIALATGGSIYLMSFFLFNQPTEISTGFAVVFGFLSMMIPMIAFDIIGAGATTTFVCLSEDPQALQRSKPELYAKIAQTYPQIMV